jgi:hypothetical protein
MVKNYNAYIVIVLCVETFILPWSKLDAVPVWCILYGMWWVTVTNHTPVWYWICVLHIYVVWFLHINILWLIFSFIKSNTRVRSRWQKINTARRDSPQNNRRKRRMRYGLWGWLLPTYTLICIVMRSCYLWPITGTPEWKLLACSVFWDKL